MKRAGQLLPISLCLLLTALGCQPESLETPQEWTSDYQVASPLTPVLDNGKLADITYQLLVYSFADSDGDGIGDFKGITQRLDYLDALGASALWLSPIHPAMSYHGYDVLDYGAVNPDFGTEDELKELIDEAGRRGIRIYLDYVLNHTGSRHEWFQSAKASADSPYRNWYLFSYDPQADIQAGRLDMIEPGGYDAGQWFSAGGQTGYTGRLDFQLDWSVAAQPQITVTESAAPAESYSLSDDKSQGVWLYFGNQNRNCRMIPSDPQAEGYSPAYHLVVDFDSDWGFLVRTSTTDWGPGFKWGASSSQSVLFGQPYPLKARTTSADVADLVFAPALQYHSHFWTDWFADLNYGKAAEASQSEPFQALLETAGKWIDLGVGGFRLDAVKHIYHNASSQENPEFLRQFYEACNALYHQAGHEDDIYMVGEMWDDPSLSAPYYQGLPALFDFGFWWRLEWALNNATGRYLLKDFLSYQEMYRRYRPGFVDAVKLSNHDEKRTASSLGRNAGKLKLAAAILLTAAGSPYIYQGEELGYWGVQDQGDEYVRTPIQWKADGSGRADAYLNGKIDLSMLGESISVERQLQEENSLLAHYRRFALARNAYPALARGSYRRHDVYNEDNSQYNALACWYLDADTQRALVLHNLGRSELTLTLDDLLGPSLAVNGKVCVRQTEAGAFEVTMPALSSVVFEVEPDVQAY